MKWGAFVAWLVLQITRWVSRVSFLAYSFAITTDRPSHLDHFGGFYIPLKRGCLAYPFSP